MATKEFRAALVNDVAESVDASVFQAAPDTDRKQADFVVGYRNYFDRMTDMLKRRFGNGLAGWDISDDVSTISWA